MVQWLRLQASDAEGQVQPLVRKLRSHMLCSAAKGKTKKSACQLQAGHYNQSHLPPAINNYHIRHTYEAAVSNG